MKIENRTIDVAKSEGVKYTYADLMKSAINTTVNGLTISEMRAKMELFAILEANEAEFELMETQLNEVRQAVSNTKWTFMHIDLIAFEDYLNSL